MFVAEWLPVILDDLAQSVSPWYLCSCVPQDITTCPAHVQKTLVRALQAPGHTKYKCWEIQGKPINWQSRKKGDAHAFQVKPTQMSLEILAHPNHSPRIRLSRLNSIVSFSVKCPSTLHPVLLSSHAHWHNLVWCFRPSPQNLLDLGVLISVLPTTWNRILTYFAILLVIPVSLL